MSNTPLGENMLPDVVDRPTDERDAMEYLLRLPVAPSAIGQSAERDITFKGYPHLASLRIPEMLGEELRAEAGAALVRGYEKALDQEAVHGRSYGVINDAELLYLGQFGLSHLEGKIKHSAFLPEGHKARQLLAVQASKLVESGAWEPPLHQDAEYMRPTVVALEVLKTAFLSDAKFSGTIDKSGEEHARLSEEEMLELSRRMEVVVGIAASTIRSPDTISAFGEEMVAFCRQMQVAANELALTLSTESKTALGVSKRGDAIMAQSVKNERATEAYNKFAQAAVAALNSYELTNTANSRSKETVSIDLIEQMSTVLRDGAEYALAPYGWKDDKKPEMSVYEKVAPEVVVEADVIEKSRDPAFYLELFNDLDGSDRYPSKDPSKGKISLRTVAINAFNISTYQLANSPGLESHLEHIRKNDKVPGRTDGLGFRDALGNDLLEDMLTANERKDGKAGTGRKAALAYTVAAEILDKVKGSYALGSDQRKASMRKEDAMMLAAAVAVRANFAKSLDEEHPNNFDEAVRQAPMFRDREGTYSPATSFDAAVEAVDDILDLMIESVDKYNRTPDDLLIRRMMTSLHGAVGTALRTMDESTHDFRGINPVQTEGRSSGVLKGRRNKRIYSLVPPLPDFSTEVEDPTAYLLQESGNLDFGEVNLGTPRQLDRKKTRLVMRIK